MSYSLHSNIEIAAVLHRQTKTSPPSLHRTSGRSTTEAVVEDSAAPAPAAAPPAAVMPVSVPVSCAPPVAPQATKKSPPSLHRDASSGPSPERRTTDD